MPICRITPTTIKKLVESSGGGSAGDNISAENLRLISGLTAQTSSDFGYSEDELDCYIWSMASATNLSLINASISAGAAVPATSDVYALEYNVDLYKQVCGRGAFVKQNVTGLTSPLHGVCVAPNGNVFVITAPSGFLYKQLAGATTFTKQDNGAMNWTSVAAAVDSGNIYLSHWNNSVYKQTAGTGGVSSLTQTPRNWQGLGAAANGAMYCSVYGGDIYMRTVEAGNFVATGQTVRNWGKMCGAPNGDMYCTISGTDVIYKQAAGSSVFVSLGGTARAYRGLCAKPNGDILACVDSGDLYILAAGSTGDFQPMGVGSKAWYGIAARYLPNGGISEVCGNSYTVLGSPTKARILARINNTGGAGLVDISTTGLMKVYYSTDGNITWQGPVAIAGSQLVTGNTYDIWTAEFNVSGATQLGVRVTGDNYLYSLEHAVVSAT